MLNALIIDFYLLSFRHNLDLARPPVSQLAMTSASSNSSSADELKARGNAHFQKGQLDEAIASYRSALDALGGGDRIGHGESVERGTYTDCSELHVASPSGVRGARIVLSGAESQVAPGLP